MQADRVSATGCVKTAQGSESSYFLPSVFRFFLLMLLIVLTRRGLIVASCLNPFWSGGGGRLYFKYMAIFHKSWNVKH